MALCSQVFNTNNKRSCNFSNTYHQAPAAKKICLSSLGQLAYPSKKSVSIYTSSEEDNDSEDEQSCYNADQIRAKRRASTRVSFSMNSKLSRAISQYSDEDEEAADEEHEEEENSSRRSSVSHRRRESTGAGTSLQSDTSVVDLENLDCKLSSSPVNSGIALNFYSNKGIISDNNTSTNAATKNIIPLTDKSARSRCFEYLVGAIDEAWARYCDATAYVEDAVYGYNTPASVATDEEEYLDNTTDITDYDDTDFEDSKHHQQPQSFRPRLSSSASCASLNSTREDPSSCQLSALKDRLTKAKYYLQDLVDSDSVCEVNSFWKRWDMIKYATIELVEDDDDDEIVETTIEELESGRFFAH